MAEKTTGTVGLWLFIVALAIWNVWLTSELADVRSEAGNADARAAQAFARATEAKNAVEEHDHR